MPKPWSMLITLPKPEPPGLPVRLVAKPAPAAYTGVPVSAMKSMAHRLWWPLHS